MGFDIRTWKKKVGLVPTEKKLLNEATDKGTLLKWIYASMVAMKKLLTDEDYSLAVKEGNHQLKLLIDLEKEAGKKPIKEESQQALKQAKTMLDQSYQRMKVFLNHSTIDAAGMEADWLSRHLYELEGK